MLWLALYLPRLPLEIYTRTAAHDGPLIVSQGQGREQCVLHVTEPARQQGVLPGMSVAAACALVGDVRVQPRDCDAESRMLQRLAAWAGQYTSLVSLEPPQALLLEIGGSLQLFGGVQRLWSRLAQDIAELGFEGVVAVAPTPLAAHWLAHARREVAIAVAADIPAVLGRLPLTALPWAAADIDKLLGVGLRYLQDVWRLPRGGLTRRFGADFVRRLDQARGSAADVRAAFASPPVFNGEIALVAATTDSAALIFAAHRLLRELAGFLRARGAGVHGFDFELLAARTPAVKVRIATGQAHRHEASWRTLVREKFERLRLSAPVEGLRLRASRIEAIADISGDLFDDPMAAQDGVWLDRVRARLGDDAVQGLYAVAEHRPEYAWRSSTLSGGDVAAPASSVTLSFAERPLWLLASPLALKINQGQLWHRGVLRKVRGPERIESGWWDDKPVARDYYVVENATGVRYWVFREGASWYLHGVFW